MSPVFSVTGEAFADARRDDVYQFEEDIFNIEGKVEETSIKVINPVYRQDVVKDQLNVLGEMTLDVSKYSQKQCFHVFKSNGADTGYIIYKMDDEIWISHWRAGENQYAWCEYILRLK